MSSAHCAGARSRVQIPSTAKMLGKGGSLPGAPVLGRQKQGIPRANWLAAPPEPQALASVRDPASNKMKINEEKHPRPSCCCYLSWFVFPDRQTKAEEACPWCSTGSATDVWQTEKEGQRTAPEHVSITYFSLKVYFVLIYVNICVCVHVCTPVWDLAEVRWGCQTLWSWSYRSVWATWCQGWEQNWGPLEEQEGLTTVPSLRPGSFHLHLWV